MKITIELDPGELAAIFAQLAGAFAQHKLPPLYPFSDGVTTKLQLDPAGELEFVQEVDPPLARNGFTYTAAATPATQPLRPAVKKPTAEQRLAASKVGADLASKRRANGAGMEFEEFDALVKREVRRLAAGKTMPSHALWNEMKDPKLPTLSTVIARYGAGTAEELAVMLGYNPPLRGIKPQRPADEETQEAEAVSA